MASFRSSPETFLVEELPAYVPCGQGEHTYLWIEKRGLTTPEALRRLAHALGVPDRELGYAGLKDRHATTRQWVSAPRVPIARAAALVIEDLRVLEVRQHGNKLRPGHLEGNRFDVVLTDVTPKEVPLLARAFEEFVRQGLPNVYGEQRFGVARDNVERGIGLMRGAWRERDHRKRRLLLSSVQSAAFNRTLERRGAEPGGLLRVRTGDVLQKVGSGGIFVTTDIAVDQARVDAGEIVPTGPMPGGRELAPPPGSEAAALEEQAMASLGLTAADFAAVGRDLPGARRPVVVAVGSPMAPMAESGGRLRLGFSLPAGSYATVLLAALAERAARDAGAPVLTFTAPTAG